MKKVLMLSLIMLLSGAVSMPQLSNAQEFYLGQVITVGFNFCPVGWLPCDGRLLSIAQNTALFSLLGTTYGGDGIRTFALPDLRSRVALGQGQGPGLSDYVLGEKGGDESTTLTEQQMPSHNHHLFASTNVAGSPQPGGDALANTQRTYIYSSGTPATAMNLQSIGSAGGNQPFDNRQPFLAINYCIATQGIFPSRP